MIPRDRLGRVETRATETPVSPNGVRLGYEPERYEALLQALLGSTVAIRDAANTLLFSFIIYEPRDALGIWSGRTAAALHALGNERDRFLRALVAWWAERHVEGWRSYASLVGLHAPAVATSPGWHALTRRALAS
jgi:hypothetical protein